MPRVRPIEDYILAPVKARIEADTNLTGLAVITMDRGDITNEITRAIANAKHKVFVVVEVLGGTNEDNLATQGIKVTLTIEENVSANRKQADFMAYDYVLFALWTLFGTPAGNANQELLIRPESWETLQNTDDKVVVQITARTNLRMERVHDPD